MTIENWKEKALETTLKVYENERETLSKYEYELMWKLHHAAIVPNNKHISKVGRCLAELVMAQTEYVNSLKAKIADKFVAMLPESKKTDDSKHEMTAEELVEVGREVAIRASHAAGLIEQAKNAQTERETLDAMANFEANLYTKSRAISKEWHEAMDFFKFESIEKIAEREFMKDDRAFTIGEYLKLIAKISA